jgi:hypothetical protein
LHLGVAQRGTVDIDADAAVPQAVEQRIDEVLLLEELVPVVKFE